MFDFLKGYKTYIVSFLALVVEFLVFTNVITQDTANLVLGILAALGLSALRSGVKSAENK